MEASEVQFGESGWVLAPIEPQDLVRVDSDEAAIPKINKAEEAVTREYTIHLRKLLHGISFKKRAPRAVKEVKAFAKKMMGTEVRAPVLCSP